jgi:hypothetical protein
MINLFNRVLSKVLATVYLFNKVSFFRILKNHDRSSRNIVWIKVNPLLNILSYLKFNDLLTDLSLINGLIENDKKFKIVFGKNIGKANNCTIYYGISETANPYSVANYSKSLYFSVKLIESQGNKMFPNPESILFWENKDYMHEEFMKKQINHPETIIYKLNQNQNLPKINYPVLIKEIHSAGSKGLYLIKNEFDLYQKIDTISKKGHNSILIQKLINMRKDLRVVVVNEKVTSFYWRVNPDSEWKPTATSFGGYTDFGNFPSQWEALFIDYTKKLGLLTCAYDVTWENDDLNTDPIILEVSPHYQLNPELPSQFKNMPYKKWKQKVFIRNAYHTEYVKVVLANFSRLVKLYS